MMKTLDTLEPVVESHANREVVSGVAEAVAGGTAGYAAKADQRFEDVESELERTWPTAGGNSLYEWKRVRGASRDSWTRVRRR